MTGAFTRDPDMAFPKDRLLAAIGEAAGPGRLDTVDATALATALLGDAIATNLFMVGYAWQKGLIPLSAAAIERAIELNGVAVALNRGAFLWGRRAAAEPAAVAALVRRGKPAPSAAAQGLTEIVEQRVAFLTDYQDAAYARRYREEVERVRVAEAAAMPGRSDLAVTVARNLFRLMAIKDEYEVARLWTDGSFKRQLEAEFESWKELEVHLAPPLFAQRDPKNGHLVKRRYGAWLLPVLGVLAKGKRLRGTVLDIFGRTAERRLERKLLADYEALLVELTAKLTSDNHGVAVELARVPEQIRGFGHVKEANVERAKLREAELRAAFDAEPAVLAAAE